MTALQVGALDKAAVCVQPLLVSCCNCFQIVGMDVYRLQQITKLSWWWASVWRALHPVFLFTFLLITLFIRQGSLSLWHLNVINVVNSGSVVFSPDCDPLGLEEECYYSLWLQWMPCWIYAHLYDFYEFVADLFIDLPDPLRVSVMAGRHFSRKELNS